MNSEKDAAQYFSQRLLDFLNYNSWVWAWAIPSLNKNETNICKQVFKYGTDLDSNVNVSNLLIKSILNNSRLKIMNDVEIEIKIAITLYLSKKLGAMKLNSIEGKDTPNKDVWIIITKIIDN